MIVKRSLKSVMPSMKRCRAGGWGGEDDGDGGSRKRRKTGRDVGAIPIPISQYGIQRILAAKSAASWCAGVKGSYCPGETEAKSKAKKSGGNRTVAKQEKQESPSKPALVRSSRGRVQVLPARLKDSIIDPWKKESKGGMKEEAEDPEFDPLKDKCSSKGTKVRGELGNYKNGSKVPSFFENGGMKSLSSKKYSSSRSTLTSLRGNVAEAEEDEELEDDEEDDEEEEDIELSSIDRFCKEEVKRKGKVFGPKDFGFGEVVWAISGTSPAWPAIILDPESQAPPKVLNYRIAGAACVMFFGYSSNGTQRVCL